MMALDGDTTETAMKAGIEAATGPGWPSVPSYVRYMQRRPCGTLHSEGDSRVVPYIARGIGRRQAWRRARHLGGLLSRHEVVVVELAEGRVVLRVRAREREIEREMERERKREREREREGEHRAEGDSDERSTAQKAIQTNALIFT
jgi:hypothetical protein